MQVADVGNGHLSSVNLLSSINLLWPVFRGAFFRGCVHLFHHIRFSRSLPASLPASLPDLQSLESKRFHRIQKFLSKQNNVLRTSSFEISDWRSSLSYMKAIYRRCQRLSLLNSPLVSISSFCSQRFDEFWFEVSISSANLALTQQCLRKSSVLLMVDCVVPSASGRLAHTSPDLGVFEHDRCYSANFTPIGVVRSGD